mmetsp:Transcript_22716/g.69147  ORF Transcript_22716/g.69147 Transcript_22716/m.69147 type:complete len:339 (+) Transcript_22716:103-1119(+)
MLALLCSSAAYNVAVTGATGRTGRLVVDSLLKSGHSVTALVRDGDKAASVLPAAVACRELDLATAGAEEMRTACAGADKLIWCATGFTDAGELIDVRGMKQLVPGAIAATGETPAVVMLSSAGVTRPAWDDAKKARLIGCSDIPIIRLNPGGILGKKCEAEQALRESGVPYCVVRPTGLKFEGWPQGRPFLSQGDVAVGRCNAVDLAETLVGVLGEAAAAGKTFELFTLAGYPPPSSLSPALERLSADAAGPLPEAAVDAAYDLLQQCLPGEEQDATKLEMGRTYEQVDSGEVRRESGAPPTERELSVAGGALEGMGARGSGGKRGLLKRLFRIGASS